MPDAPTPPLDADLARARPGAALAALATSRVRIEAAELHLRKIVELGDRLNARRGDFDAVASGNSPAAVDAARAVVDDPAVDAAMATVERARAALAELAKWKERGYG